jgi:Flp pilus assembly protein TadG
MARKANIFRRFAVSTRAVAAIEFAMVLPVLAILFLASFDGGRAIAIYMKVRAATYALDTVTNQYSSIQSTDMTSIMQATSLIMAPYSSAPIVVTISQIAISGTGNATVAWSYSLNGTARSQGSAISVPTAFDNDNSYLVFAEVSYTFTPIFGFFTPGTITFSDNLYVTPRSSNCIAYVPETGTSCT